jgi:fatty acid desaturase
MNYWTDCMDHAGLVASEDELDSSRNIVAPGLVRWLLFPRSDCFHLVHHLFPHIPARHLESCHRLLEWDNDYASRRNATRRAEGVVQSKATPVFPAE